jgi:predicted metal-dependent HD superfamily phosphohydrolase
MPRLEADWHALWKRLALDPPAHLYRDLVSAWRAPGRHYHDVRHLEACLAWRPQLRALATHPDAVELALWFHDAVYEPRRRDNEERSAAWARTALFQAGADARLAHHVHRLVLSTRQHGPAEDADTRVLCDIDLAILGAAPERYAEYENDIRAEYAWVPEPEFRAARRAVLEGFLARPAIYATAPFAEQLEAQARTNLAGAIARLA